MSDIELVIKIDEEQYKFIKQSMTMDKVKDYHALLYNICEHIKNGTPLPKGHGELIERDKIEYLKAIHDAKYGRIPWSEATRRIKYSAPTIIDADTESEDKEGL